MLLALALALLAPPSAPQAGTPPLDLANLGHAVVRVALEGDVLAFALDEQAAGAVDRNGDGDAFDHVVHVLDLATGEVTNLGLAATIADARLEVVGGRVVFGVAEFLQGGEDLNGDGDSVDIVLHVHDAASGATTNAGVALYAGSFSAGSGVIAAAVREFDQGFADLNGDGDTLDAVLHAVDPATGAVQNLGVATQLTYAVGGALVGFWVPEPQQGGTDLNGDGDASDWVAHAHDAGTGATANLALGAVPSHVAVEDGYVAFAIGEGNQGQTDLNGDGDASDTVLFVHDAAAGATHNSGYAILTGSLASANFEIDAGRIAFRVGESSQGQQDLNGDGSLGDAVVHVMDLPAGPVVNVGLAAWDVRLSGQLVAARVSESAHFGQDLNGDGDANDRVLHVHELATGETHGLGLHVRLDEGGYELRGALVVALVQELGQGQLDLNGDGDDDDDVLAVHDLSTGETRNVGRAVDRFAFPAPQVVLHVREAEQGADGNGDGDLADVGLELFDPASATLVPFGLAVTAALVEPPPAASGARVAFRASEAGGALDLNGDGDATDSVLHVAEHGFARGLLADGVSLSLAQGGTQALAIDAGSAHAGELYWILGSTSGTEPGWPGPPPIPLVVDAYTLLTLQQPGLLIAGQVGFLDAHGRASAALTLPPGFLPSLAGAHADHAAVVIDVAGSGALSFATNAVPLDLAP